MTMRISFVVHRYPPYAGGSEYYVQQMAEETASRGYEVNVVSEFNHGDVNGIRVSSNTTDLMNSDLIVVHGGGPAIQSYVLSHASSFRSKVMYLLIEPSDHPRCISGMRNADYIGCSTIEDWEHVSRHGVLDKSHKVIHGISPKSVGDAKGFRNNFGIPNDVTLFLSCGGYWPNKRMAELAWAFIAAEIPNSMLITTGYHLDENMLPFGPNVFPLMIDDPSLVKDAIAAADCYVMNSVSEGFGLTILESMINLTPWIGRNIAGARLLAGYGQVYQKEEELITLMQTFQRDEVRVSKAFEKIMRDHLISNTVDDILKVL